VRSSDMKRPAVLSTAPAATACPSHSPPTDRAIDGRAPVVHWLHSSAPLARAAPTGSTYAAVRTTSARSVAERKARSGERASPRIVAGVSNPEQSHIPPASPSPAAPSPCPAGASGVHGDTRGPSSATTVSTPTGRRETIASATAALPVGRTPSRLSPVRATMKTTTRSQRSGGVISGTQKRRYSTNSAGYTATSTKLSIQLHQPTWNAQYGPNAWRVHVT